MVRKECVNSHENHRDYRKQTNNSLEGLIEADGGGTVEDDINVFNQDVLILFTQIQLWQCEVTVHCNDLLCKAWLLILQSFKQLSGKKMMKSN